MRLKSWVALALVMVCTSLFAQTEQHKMSPEEQKAMDAWQKFMTPGDAHKSLNALVGTFDAKVSMWPQPGAPAQVSTATSVDTWVLGNRYVEENVTGSFMGMPFQGIGYTGYDNGKKQYVGTWIDNFGTGVMTSTGTSADNGKTYTFTSNTTDPMTGKDMPGSQKMSVTDADHHTLEMWGPAPDGKMFKMMQIDYSRKK
jgi:Protein of unknown function (DUF1579)